VTAVDMWFDPVCPWAWNASRWLVEVERVRDVTIRFRVMSLSVLNDSPEGWEPVRVMAATELAYGPDAVRALYATMGTAIHTERLPIGRDLFALALGRAGLPHTLANAALTDAYDGAVRASHHAGVATLGDLAATPVIRLPGPDGLPVAFVGPVIRPAPTGDAAGDLWDGLALAARTEGFFELRRPRTRRPPQDRRDHEAGGAGSR